jgi:hypothetical protein
LLSSDIIEFNEVNCLIDEYLYEKNQNQVSSDSIINTDGQSTDNQET